VSFLWSSVAFTYTVGPPLPLLLTPWLALWLSGMFGVVCVRRGSFMGLVSVAVLQGLIGGEVSVAVALVSGAALGLTHQA
jgi:hypothetical protein